MQHELPALPYARDELEPHISEETLDFHYGKHHQGYVNNLNALLPETPFADAMLDDIVRESTGAVFNNAAQVWNHTFYWQSMTPGGREPGGALASRIATDFGSFAEFKSVFTSAATGQFGSGWAWLVQRRDGSLAVRTTSNADTPLVGADTPLLTCDVWEHAYYIDRRNDRGAYIDSWWNVVNWDFAAQNANLE